VGKHLLVIGRGTQRGEPLRLTNANGVTLKGWYWGFADAVQRWGENRVESIVDGNALASLPGEPVSDVGELLRASFDAVGESNEAHLSAGDSGGPVFIQEGGTWKLAGVNYGVDGAYNTTTNGAGFPAAVFDEGGLYVGEEDDWELRPVLSTNTPGGFYATRISSNLPWINSVLAISQTIPDQPTVHSASSVAGPYARDPTAFVDVRQAVAHLPVPDRLRFYRLEACASLEIRSIKVESGKVQLNYGDP
jgi:hypothetical protein